MNFPSSLRRGKTVGMVLAVLGLGAWGYGMVAGRQIAMQSYLYGYMVWVTLALGCFALSLLHNATRATWSLPLIRLLEAGGGAASLLTMAVLFVPIAVFLPDLYIWADPSKVQVDHILQAKSPYLNSAFFLGEPQATSPSGPFLLGSCVVPHCARTRREIRRKRIAGQASPLPAWCCSPSPSPSP